MNGRSYYRWILNLVRRVQTEVIHMKAQTNQVNLSLLLNYEADHYASTSQKFMNGLHPVPIPTFFMDNFMFYWPLEKWMRLSPVTKKRWSSAPAMRRPKATSKKPCSKSKHQPKRRVKQSQAIKKRRSPSAHAQNAPVAQTRKMLET